MEYYAGLSCSDTRKHQRTVHPVGLLDDVQAIRVAVSDEDAEGERDAHYIALLRTNRRVASVLSIQ